MWPLLRRSHFVVDGHHWKLRRGIICDHVGSLNDKCTLILEHRLHEVDLLAADKPIELDVNRSTIQRGEGEIVLERVP